MAIIKREDRYKAKKFKLKAPEIVLDEIINGQMRIKRGMAMMYIAITGEKRFKTRGEHSEEVAMIGEDLAKRLGGDYKKARRIGRAHDFGHSLFAHTGESALGRFLISPDKFLENSNIDPRSAFDHSKHGAKAFKITAKKINLDIPDYIINGIESHSTGSSSTGTIKCESFEAECIMRADKIASSISDTQDMLKAGVFDLTDESLNEVFDNNETIKNIISKRIFNDYKNNGKAFDEMLELAIRLGGENAKKLKELRENPKKENRDEIFRIFDEIKEQQLKKHIANIKSFIKLSPEAQRERMLNLIVDGIENSGKKVDVETTKDYSKIYPNGQLYITKDVEAILAGLRGLLISMEEERRLGKTGSELEGLVETVARYVYSHEKEFKNEWPFRNWRKDENDKKLEWKYQVAYGLAQMQDEQFKRFVIKLQQRGDAKEILKNCKYRDPRDTVYMKKHPKVKLPLSTYDFSTKESIEAVWNIDVKREYQPPMYEDLGFVDGDEKEIRKHRSIEVNK